MSNLTLNDEFFDYSQFLTRSFAPSDKSKQTTPSQVSSQSQRLKCFTEFGTSPDLNNSFPMKAADEDKTRRSYEFTYKILFNVPFEEKEGSEKPIEGFKDIFQSFEEKQAELPSKQSSFCLCNLDVSEKPTRNIRIDDYNLSLENVIGLANKFGELANVDHCDFPSSVVLCFYDLNSAAQFAHYLATQNFNHFSNVAFIKSLNEPSFNDYIIVKESFDTKNEDFESIFSLFGQTYEINYLQACVIIKYSNLHSLRKLEKCLSNFQIDARAQLKFLRNVFINIPEEFIAHVLSRVVMVSNQNYTDLFFPQSEKPFEGFSAESFDKENCPPNLFSQYEGLKPKKKPLKLSSSVFSLSEISSVNDANNMISSLEKDPNAAFNSTGSKQNFTIDIELIKLGLEKRTTIMIRNIPNRYNQESLLRVIDVKFKGMYDFVYLPMDFKNKCNIGYAFVNFLSTKCILDFYLEFHNKRWDLLRSEKICCVCFARIQGRNQLIKHFKKSNVIHMPLDKNYKPLILPNPLLDSQMLQIHSFD